MTSKQVTNRLLRWYPRWWRERYGTELISLVDEMTDGRGPDMRMKVDIAIAGVRERVRPHHTTAHADACRRLVWAWTVFVIAGLIVAKASEGWTEAMPGKHLVPSGFFNLFVGFAILGSIAVVLGAALAVPAAFELIREGRSAPLRRPFMVAGTVTIATVVATRFLSTWAHSLTVAQRNGNDAAYSAAFLAWVVLVVATFGVCAWFVGRIANALDLSPLVRNHQRRLIGAIAVLMACMTASFVAWWVSVATTDPGALTGTPVRASGSPYVPTLMVAGAMMCLATVFAGMAAKEAREFDRVATR